MVKRALAVWIQPLTQLGSSIWCTDMAKGEGAVEKCYRIKKHISEFSLNGLNAIGLGVCKVHMLRKLKSLLRPV